MVTRSGGVTGGRGQSRPLVADRRYGAPAASARGAAAPTRSAAGGGGGGGRSGGGNGSGSGNGGGRGPAKKPARQPRARRKHGVIVGTVLFFWRMIWAVLWRVTAVALLCYAAVVYYFYSQLPDVHALLDGRSRGSVTLLDRDSKVFAWRGETFGGQIGVENVSKHLHDAVVATEDKRFYWHYGVSPRGIASAIRINLSEGRGAFQGNGGSTITQQVAKLLCLGVQYDKDTWKSEAEYERDCRSGGIVRKLKEVPFSMAMEAKYSKAEILTIYMNRAYLGAGARGFEAASQRYFGKSSANVTPAEAAMLAGLLQAPSALAPTANLQRSQDRANVVIGLMQEQGYLSKAEADEARAHPAQLSDAARQQSGGFFADWVMETTPDYLSTDTTEDVIIETTLDQRMQAQSEAAIKHVFETKVREGSQAQAAVVVMSSDGAVRAMVGGRNIPRAGDFNRATMALRQTGSSFKPFIYAAALDEGYSPNDLVDDSPLTINVPGSGPYTPKNYDGRFKGLITLTQALAESRNIPAVKISELVGRARVREVATAFGVASKMADGPALALGASESTLIEMTGAYAGILNGGSAVTPYGLRSLKLKGENEQLMGQEGGIGDRVISETAAHALNYMMVQVLQGPGGTGGRARLPDREAAGKTGTTNGGRDAWFVGYTADYVVGVWLGYDDNRPLSGVTGGGLPAEIWREVMVRINKGLPVSKLQQAVPPSTAAPTAPEDVPWFDSPDAPVYQGGSSAGASSGNVPPAGTNLGPVEGGGGNGGGGVDDIADQILRELMGN